MNSRSLTATPAPESQGDAVAGGARQLVVALATGAQPAGGQDRRSADNAASGGHGWSPRYRACSSPSVAVPELSKHLKASWAPAEPRRRERRRKKGFVTFVQGF